MLNIRSYKPDDDFALRRIHAAQHFDYPFPDLSNPLFLTKIILEDDGQTDGAQPGRGIIGGAVLRLTAEAYLFLDPLAGTPVDRWQSVLLLHAAAEREAQRVGLEDVHAWIPPQVAEKFGRRLMRLGWQRDDRYTPFCKFLNSK